MPRKQSLASKCMAPISRFSCMSSLTTFSLRSGLYDPRHAFSISFSAAEKEIEKAWRGTYSPERNEKVVNELIQENLDMGAMHLLARLCFRGIYVPQMTRRAWLNLIFQNRRSIFKLLRSAIAKYREVHDRKTENVTAPAMN